MPQKRRRQASGPPPSLRGGRATLQVKLRTQVGGARREQARVPRCRPRSLRLAACHLHTQQAARVDTELLRPRCRRAPPLPVLLPQCRRALLPPPLLLLPPRQRPPGAPLCRWSGGLASALPAACCLSLT